MSIELVTGHAGRNHVDSEDVGAFYAGVVGKGRYALDVGENLAVTMSDANTVRIGTGLFVMDGRYVRVKDAESVKVANGAQAAYRKDLVVCTYTRDPSNGNVEGVAVSVLQGTAAAKESDAKAPTFEKGDILNGDLKATVAIAEVDLAGLTPKARLLLPNVASLKSIGDSVSQDIMHRGTYAITTEVSGWSGEATVTTNQFDQESNRWEYDRGCFSQLRANLWTNKMSEGPWSNAVLPPGMTPGAMSIWWAKIPIKVTDGSFEERIKNVVRLTVFDSGGYATFLGSHVYDLFLGRDGYPYACIGAKDRVPPTAATLTIDTTIFKTRFDNARG